jgi:hypothetical protein
MGLFRRLQYLLPGRRAAEEREMRAEFEALREFADPRDLGNLTLAAENARAVWGWAWLATPHRGRPVRRPRARARTELYRRRRAVVGSRDRRQRGDL